MLHLFGTRNANLSNNLPICGAKRIRVSAAKHCYIDKHIRHWVEMSSAAPSQKRHHWNLPAHSAQPTHDPGVMTDKDPFTGASDGVLSSLRRSRWVWFPSWQAPQRLTYTSIHTSEGFKFFFANFLFSNMSVHKNLKVPQLESLELQEESMKETRIEYLYFLGQLPVMFFFAGIGRTLDAH